MARTRRRSVMAATISANGLGYANPRIAREAEGLSKHIITDMYAKAVQGMAPGESVKRAEVERRRTCSA